MIPNDPAALPTRPALILVEDDDGIRRSLQLLLQGQGFDVRAFSAVRPALAAPQLARTRYLVIDYVLADTDGITLLGQFRAGGWEGVAVLITAFASHEIREAAAAAGFAAVLDKPFRDSALLGALWS